VAEAAYIHTALGAALGNAFRTKGVVVVVAALRADASATTALTVSVLDINQTGKEQDAASAIPPVVQENVWMVANK
jgi:hypothetical protein